MGFLTDKEEQQGQPPIADPMAWKPSGNILAAISGPPQSQQPATEPKRKRLSALDILGAIADAGAEFGGSNAGYREGVARREAAQNEELDRSWMQKFNAQKLAKGQSELAGDRFERFGQAARGLGAIMENYGAPGVAKAFPLIAQQMGMDEEEQAIFKTSLDTDPQGTLEMLSAATDPSVAGSQPKEITIYKLLQKRDPEAAKMYLEKVATGAGEMSDYQREQIRLREAEIGARDRRDIRGAQTRIRVAGIRGPSGAAAKAKGGAPVVDPASLGLALQVTGELRGIYNDLRKQGAIVDTDAPTGSNIAARARASGVGQLVEGALGTRAQTGRDKIEGIRPNLIRRISEATGMTASQMNSDKDMALLLAQVTDPTMSYQANMAAISRLENLIKTRSGAASAPSRPKLRPRPGAGAAAGKRMKYNPATGRIE